MTIRRISRALGVAASTAVAVLMLLMVTDVSARAELGVSVPGLIEVAGSLMVVAVFLGLAVGQRTSGHIRVKMLTDRLPTRLARPVRTGALTVSMTLPVRGHDRPPRRAITGSVTRSMASRATT
jgi:TRAP-type C4-dicarboxylate transport system permease small subunit